MSRVRGAFLGLLVLFMLVVPVGLAQGVTEVIVGIAGDPPGGDPHKARGAQGGHILYNLHAGLVELSGDLEHVTPMLASSWEQVGDLTWHFQLREGLTFHNGERFDAHAVEYSFNRLMDPNAVRLNSDFQSVEHVIAVGDYVVEVKLAAPIPSFFSVLSSFQVVPPEYTASVTEEEYALKPVGIGPYTFVSWQPGQPFVMEAFDGYWAGRPQVDRIVFRPIPEASTRLAELLAGTVHIIAAPNYDDLAQINANPSTRVAAAPGRRTVFLNMDHIAGLEPLQNALVRQAMGHAIDRQLLIEALMSGYGEQLATLWRSDMFGYDASLLPYEFDPARARELLAEAGYPNGFQVRMLTSEIVVNKGLEVAEAVAAMLTDVGIVTEVVVVPDQVRRNMYIANTNRDNLQPGEVEPLWLANWGAGIPDASSPLQGLLHTSGTSSFTRIPELDAMIEAFVSEGDEQVRLGLAAELQQYLYTEMLQIPLYTQSNLYGVSERLDWEARKDEYVLGVDISVR
ncbi:MAG: hypothetical protein KF813_03495 [Trueperaceae bacterium]|nr:hypothetical protein [Trueperaceae bacterium]